VDHNTRGNECKKEGRGKDVPGDLGRGVKKRLQGKGRGSLGKSNEQGKKEPKTRKGTARVSHKNGTKNYLLEKETKGDGGGKVSKEGRKWATDTMESTT